MKVFTDEHISAMKISSRQCVEWTLRSLLSKPNADLPPKTWLHYPGDIFVNTMPCVIPEIQRYGVKVVTRHPGQHPALKSKLLLMNMTNGDFLACMDAGWITAMRTGAVAALAVKTFTKDFGAAKFGMVGLGRMAHATFECLNSLLDRPYEVYLLRYKDQAERFAAEYGSYENVKFHIVDTKEELIANTDTLISCVTVMNEQFMPASAYPAGYTLIPVHMRGFQECDRVFDKVFGDDRGHLEHFQYFNQFKSFAEFSDVLSGKALGRTDDKERIVVYNIGLGLHDVWFAHNIFELAIAND